MGIPYGAHRSTCPVRSMQAGLDATHYAGHSLRAGLATAAAQAGVSERVIMAQTGHRSERMVRRYIRNGSLLLLKRAPC